MLKIETIISEPVSVNCYLIYDSQTLKTLIVDPGGDFDKVISAIKKNNLKPEMLINTHSHFDHCLSDDKIRDYFKIPFLAHKNAVDILADPQKNFTAFYTQPVSIRKPDILLEDGQIITLSFTKFKVWHTPGHSSDSLCLEFDEFLITGDTLFAGDIGRTDFEDASAEQMKQSLKKIKKLNPALKIYPGHAESSTLSYEIANNQYLRQIND